MFFKGENAYYYAHGRKYEQDNSQQGPVLMSGGEPILVQKTSIDVKEIKVVNKTTKIFDKYQFCDDDEYVEVEIKLSNYYKDISMITDDCLDSKIEEKSLKLVLNVKSEDRQLFVQKLHKSIVPEESSIKLTKGKIIIRLKKKETFDEWEKLSY